MPNPTTPPAERYPHRRLEGARLPAIVASETSCGVGGGDFCTLVDLDPQAPHCTMFGEPLEVVGEIEIPPGGAPRGVSPMLRRAISPLHRRIMGAVLGLGPTVKRCAACLAADRGPLEHEEGERLLREAIDAETAALLQPDAARDAARDGRGA